MPKNPPEDMPRITPYLLYNDVDAALDFLTKAFGFKERMRLPGPDGKANHAEMALEDGVVMMGNPGGDYRNPKTVGQPTHIIYVYVDDVDAHFERAKAAGATVLDEPEDQFYGDRRYAVDDLEGHRWNFAQRVKDVAPEDMTPPQ